MKKRAEESINEVFGRVRVLYIVEKEVGKDTKVMCRCMCGNEKEIILNQLRRGRTQSCGCLRREVMSKRQTTHGLSGTETYSAWNHMMDRCYNRLNDNYRYYGGRGIQVCERWFRFENFLIDMGKKPIKLTLERINTNGDYCPENCKWATMKEQNNNKRNNRLLSFRGVIMSVTKWAEKLGINSKTLQSRVNRGWTDERILTTPVRNLDHTGR